MKLQISAKEYKEANASFKKRGDIDIKPLIEPLKKLQLELLLSEAMYTGKFEYTYEAFLEGCIQTIKRLCPKRTWDKYIRDKDLA